MNLTINIERKSFKDLLIEILKQVIKCLQKHLLGDFGEIPEEDFKENLYSLEHDLRIISSYSFDDNRILIITDADYLLFYLFKIC